MYVKYYLNDNPSAFVWVYGCVCHMGVGMRVSTNTKLVITVMAWSQPLQRNCAHHTCTSLFPEIESSIFIFIYTQIIITYICRLCAIATIVIQDEFIWTHYRKYVSVFLEAGAVVQR